MTDSADQQARLLVVAAGGYLRNVIREPLVTCATCTAPVAGYTRCAKCHQDAVSPAGTRFDGQHVMLLDDTWTSGSRTQSAAVLLRQHGAGRVSVMTIARWIEPGWGDNQAFIRERLTADFDPARCPVTGSGCP